MTTALRLVLLLALGTASVTRADDPAQRGSFAVRSHRVECRVGEQQEASFLEVRLPDAPGPWPVVVICHGWAAHAKKFVPLAEHLASRGFVTACFEQPDAWGSSTPRWARQLKDGIAALEAAPALAGRLDWSRLALVGHSYGAAASVVVASEDPRVRAVVALSPVNQPHRALLLERGARLTMPLLVISGQLDWIATRRYTQALYEAATRAPRRQFLHVAWAGHDLHVGGGSKAELSRRYTTAWLERALLGAAPSPLTSGAQPLRDLKEKRLVRALISPAVSSGLTASIP